MKRALQVILFFVFPKMVFSQNQAVSENKTYFFCTSRTLDIELVNEIKQEILYTEIKTMNDPNSNQALMTKKWEKYANVNCNYEQCIADVYFFKSLEKAKEKFAELIHVNLERSKYILVDINIE